MYGKTTYDADVDQKWQGSQSHMTCGYPPTNLTLQMKVNYFSDPSKNSDSKDKGGTTLFKLDKQRYLNETKTIEDDYKVTLKSKQWAEFQFRSYITGERQMTAGGIILPVCDKKAYVEGNWHVNCLRLAWPQPTLEQ